MSQRTLKRAALRSLAVAAPALLARLAADGYVGPSAGVVTVAVNHTTCAVLPRAEALRQMRDAGGFDVEELARVERPSPPSALPVVLLGVVRGTARVVSLARGGRA